MTLGHELRRLRKGAGLSVEELARLVSCHPGSLRRIECGGRSPSGRLIEKIGAALGGSVRLEIEDEDRSRSAV